MRGFVIKCLNDRCAVLTFLWNNPGDACPGCFWIGESTGEMLDTNDP